ncbi:MAG: hypothetical protein V4714_05220 [Bacteroidota bacterium]
MVVKLALDATPTEILKAVEAWVKFLEQEDYPKAYAYTEHDEYYQWSPELIKEVISGYGLPEPHPNGEVFKVTSVDPARNQDRMPCQEVNYNDEPLPYEEKEAEIIGQVWYDLPLNGEWSDLTATFQILKREAYLTLELAEIHVF